MGVDLGMSKEEVDPCEDVNGMPFWIWEMRSLSYLDDSAKQRASLLRQKHKQVVFAFLNRLQPVV